MDVDHNLSYMYICANIIHIQPTGRGGGGGGGGGGRQW